MGVGTTPKYWLTPKHLSTPEENGSQPAFACRPALRSKQKKVYFHMFSSLHHNIPCSFLFILVV